MRRDPVPHSPPSTFWRFLPVALVVFVNDLLRKLRRDIERGNNRVRFFRIEASHVDPAHPPYCTECAHFSVSVFQIVRDKPLIGHRVKSLKHVLKKLLTTLPAYGSCYLPAPPNQIPVIKIIAVS